MGKLARCPSCGATVEFKSVVSVLAVCDYCQSTLVRRGEELENLGRMAELIEDRSPLQLGAEGHWQGVHFALIGRIQLRYDQGLWNEWHLLFDDGRSGWLSEAGGEYVLSFPLRLPDALPAFADIAVGQRYTLAGRGYSVTNVLQAECVAGAGELPFRVGAGYPAPVVDLRDEAGGFATFDYSDDAPQPLVFVGESVAFAGLAWANLREASAIPEPTVKAFAFNCPACGAALSVGHEQIATVGCTSCGAALDTRHDAVKLIARAKERIEEPRLPLGTKGKLRGEPMEIIGFMRRSMWADGVEYCWDEYVGLGTDGQLLWLTEYNGHWNLARVLARSVSIFVGNARLDGTEYKHFQGYKARVKYVLGEFPWRVEMDERARVDDYVAPPRMLSRETTAGEQTWTLSEYVEPAEIQAAFGLKEAPPAPLGVYANQPNPHEAGHRRVCRRFWGLLATALAVYVALLFVSPGRELVNQVLTFDPALDEPQLSREFRLEVPTGRLEVRNDTDLSNNWMALDISLVNKDTGESWHAQRELSRYFGVEDGESWSEGSNSDAIVFANLPAGTYVLAEDAEIGTDGVGNRVPVSGSTAGATRPVHAQLKISHPGPRGSSFILLAIFLALFPIYTRLRHHGFETRRWADSDHPLVTGGDGGDGDDD